MQGAVRGDKAHEHAWRMTVHIDGCHWHRTGYSCWCGATFLAQHERDFQEDPWSYAFADEDTDLPDDTGTLVGCARCNELKAGAQPLSYSEYTPSRRYGA